MLATFPAADEQLHPYGHQPGFSISSGDILRILQKYPGLRLKISVIEDGNNPVTGKDGKGNTFDWRKGQLYDPTSLLDALAVTPGLDRKWFNALPSPLLRPIKSAIAAGKLHCLDNSIKLDQGQWMGIRVDLEPLLGYTVKIELAHADGERWSTDSAEANPPFLQWHFRTGVHANLTEQRELFARPIARQRKLLPLSTQPGDAFAHELEGLSQTAKVCDEYRDTDLDNTEAPPASTGNVSLIPDHALEDALTRWIGERPALNSETEKTILWDAGIALSATAIVLRSREPMLRRTQTAKIERVASDAGSTDVLKLEWIITRFPSRAKSKGVKALYVSSSGTSAVAIFDPTRNDQDPIVVGAEEYAPHYLPHEGASGVGDLVQIVARALNR